MTQRADSRLFDYLSVGGFTPASDIDVFAGILYESKWGKPVRASAKEYKLKVRELFACGLIVADSVKLGDDGPSLVEGFRPATLNELEKSRAEQERKWNERAAKKSQRPRLHRHGRQFKRDVITPLICCEKQIDEMILRIKSAPSTSRFIEPIPID